MFETPSLQSLSVADLVGRGFRTFRNNALALMRWQILPAIVITCGHVLLQISATYAFKEAKAITSVLTGVAGVIAGLLISTAGVCLLLVRQIAFIRLATGISSSFAEAMQWAKRKQWTVIGLIFLFYSCGTFILILSGIEMGVSIVFVKQAPVVSIVMIILGLVTLILSIFLICFYYMTVIAATATESLPWTGLLTRSYLLMVRDPGRSIGFGLLIFYVVLILSWTLTLPIVGVSLLEAFKNGFTGHHYPNPPELPLHIVIISQIWQSVVNMILMPVIFVGYGFFYRDLKIRQEGLDISMGLQMLHPPIE